MTDHDVLARRIAIRLNIEGYFRVPKYGGAEFSERLERAQELAVKSIARELREALPTSDTDRMRFLAGCGNTNGPAIEGDLVYGEFADSSYLIPDEYYDVLVDVMLENDKVYSTETREPTDDEKLKAFRRLIDKAMEAKP